MKRYLTSLCLLLLSALAVHGDDLVLIDQGLSHAPIIVFKDAPPRTRDAAVTLADYLEKTSGVRPEILDGEPQPLPEHGIWIGYQPALKTLFPKLDFEFKNPEEILIAANDQHLVIAGRDRWDPAHMEAEGRLADITGQQQEYGTANAVYTFIQDKLGVRWFWPGATGEDVVKQSRIAFAPFEYHYHPQIRARAGMFIKLSLGDSKEGEPQLWSRYQRVQLDSLELLGGHAFSEWWDKYHEQHPDYFALQPDGTRSGHPNPHNAKLCDSNPAVWQQWLSDVEEALKVNPTRRVFNASPNDGYDAGHCICEKCVAWDQPDAEKFTWRWKGKTEERPALSDRQVTFANTLARMLKQRFPDKQLYVLLHAYGYSRPAPIKAVPEDNVIISSVANFHMRGDGVGDTRTSSMEQHAAWAQKAKNLMWRPNLGDPVGHTWGMPDVAMHQAAEDFRFVANNHGIGLFFDMFWFHWANQSPHYYVLAQLAWNPYADVQAILDDYYLRAFGPAASEMKTYWNAMEQTRMQFVKEAPNRMRRFDIPQKYTPEWFAKAEAVLNQAEAKLAGADEKHLQRLAFVRAGLEHTKLVVNTRSWMQKFEASKGKDKEAKAKALADWATAEQRKKSGPPYAINYQRSYWQPMGKQTMGMHPDNPLSGRALREKETPGLE